MSQDLKLFIEGARVDASDGGFKDLINPSNNEVIGQIAIATLDDIDKALAAAADGFNVWRRMSAWDRADILRRAARLIDERGNDIALKLTLEQGKPLAEAKGELSRCAETFEWCAAESVRSIWACLPAANCIWPSDDRQTTDWSCGSFYAVELPGGSELP